MPTASLTAAERERAEAAGKRFGEDPGLYVMIVETIMGDGVSADEAMRQAAIQYRSDGADGAARAAAGDAFAGIWFDRENGGRYTVAVTREEAVAAVEEALAKRGLGEDSAVVLVESSYQELRRAEAALDDLVFDEAGALGLGIDESGNCIFVEVDSFFPEATIDEIERKAAELGVEVHVERVDETAGDPDETGEIMEIDADGRVLERAERDGCGVWLSEGENTEVVRDSGESASWADLAPGMTIDVWFSGGVAASCPGLGEAAKVVIKGS
jgi:hypothetical protein